MSQEWVLSSLELYIIRREGLDGPAEKLSTVFQQIIAKSVSVKAKLCLVCLRTVVLALRVFVHAREGVCACACVQQCVRVRACSSSLVPRP